MANYDKIADIAVNNYGIFTTRKSRAMNISDREV